MYGKPSITRFICHWEFFCNIFCFGPFLKWSLISHLVVYELRMSTSRKKAYLVGGLILCEKREVLNLQGGQYYVLLPPQEEMTQTGQVWPGVSGFKCIFFTWNLFIFQNHIMLFTGCHSIIYWPLIIVQRTFDSVVDEYKHPAKQIADNEDSFGDAASRQLQTRRIMPDSLIDCLNSAFKLTSINLTLDSSSSI